MPYKKDTGLFKSVKELLPKHAHDIYRNELECPGKKYQDKQKRDTKQLAEELSRKIAWAEIK